jgi:hypothetical protein
VRLLWPGWMRDWVIGMSERSNPGIWGGLLCRKRYIDEMLVASRNEIQALVILGGGFDTRPYRLPALSRLPVWEVDQSENVKAKEKRLRRKASDDSRKYPACPGGFRDNLDSILAASGNSFNTTPGSDGRSPLVLMLRAAALSLNAQLIPVAAHILHPCAFSSLIRDEQMVGKPDMHNQRPQRCACCANMGDGSRARRLSGRQHSLPSRQNGVLR